MTTSEAVSVEERVAQVLAALGITRAHVAARWHGDYQGLLTAPPAAVASLALIGPPAVVPAAARAFDRGLLVATGETDAPAAAVRQALADGATLAHVTLPGAGEWSDVAAEFGEVLAPVLVDFFTRQTARAGVAAVSLPAGEGDVAGIRYAVRGSGPPLLLLPLAFAPTGWAPLLPQLAEHFTVLTLGGAHLGVIPILERRAQTAGYRRLVQTLLAELQLQRGETVLDVGCGTGAIDRLLAGWTGGANPITAVDHNGYFLAEAAALARAEGLADRIDFRRGDAEALPFPDAIFDATLSLMVAEEGDADRMLREFVRVTKPGGRVGVVVRAMDLGMWLSLPLPPTVKAKLQVPGVVGSVAAAGCADDSLYRRCRAAGLELVLAGPQFVSPMPGEDAAAFLQPRQAYFLARLEPDEADAWRAALAQATRDGTLNVATPYHCAVGRKP